MKRVLLLAVLLMMPRIAAAQDAALVGDGVEMIPPEERFVSAMTFGSDTPQITIITAESLERQPKLPPDEAKYQKFYQDAGVYMSYLMDVKLKADDKDYLVVRCDSGGSDDPECVFSTSQDPDKEGVAIPGRVFVIPGNGCVYSGGHADNMFTARALSCISDGVLKPVPQPFSYAGFQSKAIRTLTLTVDKNNGAVVTTIVPGGFVEVVLQDGDYFLLRDRFGLIGWAKLEQAQQATDIEGFFYNGD